MTNPTQPQDSAGVHPGAARGMSQAGTPQVAMSQVAMGLDAASDAPALGTEPDAGRGSWRTLPPAAPWSTPVPTLPAAAPHAMRSMP